MTATGARAHPVDREVGILYVTPRLWHSGKEVRGQMTSMCDFFTCSISDHAYGHDWRPGTHLASSCSEGRKESN